MWSWLHNVSFVCDIQREAHILSISNKQSNDAAKPIKRVMIRQKSLSDTSSPDDGIERSSTEDHVMQSPREISVADHHSPDPVCGRETPELKQKMDADHSIQKYNLQNESPMWNVRTSPRKMDSRVYSPLPFIKRDMPASETNHKAEPKVDVATPGSESIVRIDTQSPELASLKLPRIYSPVPYSRNCTTYSPVNWKKPAETSVPEEKQADDQLADDILELEMKLLSEIPVSNDNSARNSPLSHQKADDVYSNTAASVFDIKPKQKNDCISIEKVDARHESFSSEKNVCEENDTKYNMEPTKKHQSAVQWETTAKKSSKKTKRPIKESKLKKPSVVSKPQTTAVKRSIEFEDSQELLKLKNVYEAHLKEKEEFDKLIEKRENEIDEQLREMDEVMESIYSEHAELEKITGAFADAVKAHTNYMDEAARVRVQHIEQEISSDILFEENAELKDEIRELYDQINEIKERRTIGLQGLKQGTKEIECTAEQLKGKNEEMEAETKMKMEELNSLRIIMMDNDIKCVNKGEIVQNDDVTSFPRPSISKSPLLDSANTISTGLEIDSANNGNVSLAFGKSQKDNTTESGRLSKRVSEQNLALDGKERRFTETDVVKREECGEGLISEASQKYDHSTYTDADVLKSNDAKSIAEKYGEGDVPVCEVRDERISADHDRCKSDVPERQLSAVEIVRLPDVHERKSRIPKPLVQFYGSASRDGVRCKASEGSPLIMTESENSRRDVFVSEVQSRRVRKPTMGYLGQETELRRQHKSVVLEQREEMKENKIPWKDDRLSKIAVKKKEIAPNRCKKKEVKSRIETGLKNRPHNAKANKPGNSIVPVGKMDKSVIKKDAKTEQAPKKHIDKGVKANVKKEQSCTKAKKQDLPPLKNVTKNAANVPRSSSSFESKTPLPNIKPAKQHRNKAPLQNIKPANHQRKGLGKAPEQKVATHRVLPPIKRSKMNCLSKTFTNIETEDRSAQISSKNQTPEAIRVSFSPVPPHNAAKSRKPSYRTHKLQRSRQDDKIRVLSERA